MGDNSKCKRDLEGAILLIELECAPLWGKGQNGRAWEESTRPNNLENAWIVFSVYACEHKVLERFLAGHPAGSKSPEQVSFEKEFICLVSIGRGIAVCKGRS